MSTIARWTVAACIATGAVAPAMAQYKVVAPDGTVTYTDRPPATAQGNKVVPMDRASREAAANAESSLPFALRQIATRFPVTLYTTADCEPCDRGRALLRQRGVPYSERTANTDADRAAWQRVTGGSQAPTLAIGNQRLNGFEEGSWNSYLDAAGYPKQSALPASYSPPPPQPLVAPAAATPVQPQAEAPAPAAPQTPPPPASGSFRF
jgi:glutaredoxin